MERHETRSSEITYQEALETATPIFEDAIQANCGHLPPEVRKSIADLFFPVLAGAYTLEDVKETASEFLGQPQIEVLAPKELTQGVEQALGK